MSNSRRITKLEVKIATGETFINYNDATRRYIRHAQSGFSFDCKRATDAIQAANVLQQQRRSARLKAKQQSLKKQVPGPYILATGKSMSSVFNRAMTGVIRATQSMPEMSQARNESMTTPDFGNEASSLPNAELEFDTVDFSKSLESLQTLQSTQLNNLQVIKSILPELLTTNVQLPVDNVVTPLKDLRKSPPLRLVTWHLRFCRMKYEKGLPLCNCLEIKEKLALLRANLNQFLNTTPNKDYASLTHFLTNFVQLFVTLKIQSEQLYEVLHKHVGNNKQLKATNSEDTDLTADEESIDVIEDDLNETISTEVAEEELTEASVSDPVI